MNFVSGFSNQLSADIKAEMFKYRYNVFIEKLGWDLAVPPYIEKDQFDHEDTMYVVAKEEKGEIAGCARLLPTTAPYLLEKVFPELLNGLPPPKSADIWEISRFTNFSVSADHNNHVGIGHHQISELSFAELLYSTIACAKTQGAKKLLSVSPLGIESLLRKAGIRGNRLGSPKIVKDHAIIACWIDVE